jgi:hypothetical protein
MKYKKNNIPAIFPELLQSTFLAETAIVIL